MQTLYSIESMNNETRPGRALQILKKNLEHSQQLFTYLIYFIIEVARYSEKDALTKGIQTFAFRKRILISVPKLPEMKLFGQPWKMLLSKNLSNNSKVNILVDDELVRKTYLALVKSPEYKEYIALQSRDKKSEKKILGIYFFRPDASR